MEVELKITEKTDERKGISATTNLPYHIASFIGETPNVQYPQRFRFDVKDGANSQLKPDDIEIGKVYKLSLSFYLREYEGKKYQTITAWKAEEIK